jgi:hypothetical protein
MPTFSFFCTESNTYQAWFEAESLEAAQAMVDKIEQGEMSVQELPEFQQKLRGIEALFESPEQVD